MKIAETYAHMEYETAEEVYAGLPTMRPMDAGAFMTPAESPEWAPREYDGHFKLDKAAYETLPVLSWEQIYNLHREENRHGQLMQDIVDATEGNPQETAELVMPTQIL